MRADRLLELLLLLQAEHRLTAEELARRLEVSARTVYRDLEALSRAGIPVVTERGPRGGVSLVDGYRTRLTGLSRPEVESLAAFPAPRSLAEVGLSHSLETALLKLAAALPASQRLAAEQARQRLHIDSSGWFTEREEVPHLHALREAVWSDRRVELDYRSQDGHAQRHRLAPWALVLKGDRWYLVGEANGEPRVFRVSRASGVELLDERYERPVDFDLPSFWQEWCRRFRRNLPHYRVTIRTSLDGERELRRAGWPLRRIEPGDDGDGCTLELDLQRERIALNVLLGMESPFEVLAPEPIRRRLLTRAQQILDSDRSAGRHPL